MAKELRMIFSYVLFGALFVWLWLAHALLHIHETKNKVLHAAHIWGEYVMVMQGLYIINEWFKLIQFDLA
jgi:hypothetical protein